MGFEIIVNLCCKFMNIVTLFITLPRCLASYSYIIMASCFTIIQYLPNYLYLILFSTKKNAYDLYIFLIHTDYITIRLKTHPSCINFFARRLHTNTAVLAGFALAKDLTIISTEGGELRDKNNSKHSYHLTKILNHLC